MSDSMATMLEGPVPGVEDLDHGIMAPHREVMAVRRESDDFNGRGTDLCDDQMTDLQLTVPKIDRQMTGTNERASERTNKRNKTSTSTSTA